MVISAGYRIVTISGLCTRNIRILSEIFATWSPNFQNICWKYEYTGFSHRTIEQWEKSAATVLYLQTFTSRRWCTCSTCWTCCTFLHFLARLLIYACDVPSCKCFYDKSLLQDYIVLAGLLGGRNNGTENSNIRHIPGAMGGMCALIEISIEN